MKPDQKWVQELYLASHSKCLWWASCCFTITAQNRVCRFTWRIWKCLRLHHTHHKGFLNSKEVEHISRDWWKHYWDSNLYGFIRTAYYCGPWYTNNHRIRSDVGDKYKLSRIWIKLVEFESRYFFNIKIRKRNKNEFTLPLLTFIWIATGYNWPSEHPKPTPKATAVAKPQQTPRSESTTQ